MKRNNVNCKDVMEHICVSLGEEIDSPKCVEIKEHLNNCDACQKYFKSVELTIDFYRKYNVDLPGNAHNKLMGILGLEEDC